VNILVVLLFQIKRIKAEDVIKKETKELNVKTESEPVIVESGPVQYHHTGIYIYISMYGLGVVL